MPCVQTLSRLPFDFAQDERQHGTSQFSVFGFSVLGAEKPNTNKNQVRLSYRVSPKEETRP